MAVPQTTTLDKQVPLVDKGYAMAIDIGTGTIVAGLSNLENMHIPILTKIANSQAAIALEADERLAYCRASEEQLQQMQALVRKDLSYAIHKLCRREGLKSQWINALVLVGNYFQIAILLGQVAKGSMPELGKVIRQTAAELQLERLEPVSYTHLDVYTRQERRMTN